MSTKASLDHRSVAVLGILTICAYGAWYYSFGVLLEPVLTDTGWSESALTSGFALGTIGAGLGSIVGGRLFDRFGTSILFAIAGIVGPSLLFLASTATDVVVFVAGSSSAMAVFSAFGFYHATMTAVVRVNPGDPGRAIANLTVWGAFSSAITIPGTAWLAEDQGWRFAVRVLAVVTGVAFLVGAAVIRVQPRATTPDTPPFRRVLAATVADPRRRAFTVAIGLGGIAMSTLLVYQVPVMVAAGLSTSLAATMAGLRGVAQLGGRVPLPLILARLGSTGSLVAAFAAMAVGGVVLSLAGSVLLAALFAITAGFGIGPSVPCRGSRPTSCSTPRPSAPPWGSTPRC